MMVVVMVVSIHISGIIKSFMCDIQSDTLSTSELKFWLPKRRQL